MASILNHNCVWVIGNLLANTAVSISFEWL